MTVPPENSARKPLTSQQVAAHEARGPRPSRNAPEHPRLVRELRTIEAMVAIHCQAHHEPSAGTPCPACLELDAYAAKRLACCPFGAAKPTCTKCPVHCYAPARREQVRDVMRYAGPRMTLRHPWLALFHLLDKLRKTPLHPREARRLAKQTGQQG